MPIDLYSSCPGGTGKKIKFCCSDFVGELHKIDRLLEGEQHLACLQHIDRLLEQGRPRACLLAMKGLLLRITQQFEAAGSNAAAFLRHYPDNPVALAESAILADAEDRPQDAMKILQLAMTASGQRVETRVYEAMGIVAEGMLDEGNWLAGRALLQMQITLASDDREPVEKLLALNRSPGVPLIVKGPATLERAPLGAPWAGKLKEAYESLAAIHWQEAAERLAKLAAELPDVPVVWRSLATVRSWLADRQGTVEALRKYAALDVPRDDAVEAELLAMLFEPDPLGDLVEVVALNWTVRDADRLQEALLGEPRAVQVPFRRETMADDETPPPRMICYLLDRPAPRDGQALTLENMPRFIAQAMLFGRQTDREARLEMLGVSADRVEAVSACLRELAGDAVEPQPEQTSMHKTSASHEMLQRKWYPSREVAPAQLAELAEQDLRRALLEQWPARPLGILAGKSPAEAAGETAEHVKLLAAVMLLEMWCGESPVNFDFNQLRARLGLPLVEAIDPQQTPVATLPLVRLWRVTVEKLSDDDLVAGFNRSRAFAARKAMQKFAREIVARGSMTGRAERLQAYSVLAQTAEDFPQALEQIELGRQAALAAGQSCASWDLLELSFRFGHGDGTGAVRLVEHIQGRHLREQGVAETLTHMLIEVGILRPDGTPAQLPAAAEEALAAAAGPAAAEPGKLWTPDSGQTGGGGKIWTPD
jgi:hypothetical protein